MQIRSLQDKRVLITHAHAFMGPVLCEVFASHGATVVASTEPSLPVECVSWQVIMAGPTPAVLSASRKKAVFDRSGRDLLSYPAPPKKSSDPAAHATLHECLLTITQLLAPFCPFITDEQVAAGTRTRTAYRARVKKLLGKDGVILMPTVPDVAPLTTTSEGDLDDFRNRALRLLCPSGLTGFPQISIPVAMRDGAPLGLSIFGPPGSDLSLARLAAKIEVAARLRIA